MPYHPSLRHTNKAESANDPSVPARFPSNASTISSAFSNTSALFTPSRTSTMSSMASSGYGYARTGHKRGLSEATDMSPSALADRLSGTGQSTTAGTYKSMRQSLRPLSQAPGATPPPYKPSSSPHSRGQSIDDGGPSNLDGQGRWSGPPSPQKMRPHSAVLSRSDSIKPSSLRGSPSHVATPDLETLQKSSTSHLRNLSKLTESGSNEDFSINSPDQEVVGMHGRRRLQRSDLTQGANGASGSGARGYGWGERNWMDKQRQFLQAYEYLCHIGEAKEWIERIINKPIPPIVQLEEALRDGVTLAEVVQAVQPTRRIRIFRNPRLQFRHSDNIALFFRFLADVELPELFRFELIDLYEKKNIPKVIYCIHALSWLLFRNGTVGFRIGNLVGRLEFEHHELEEMQKGLDKAGVSMPSFNGMGASFGAEPEPEPIETEQERFERELAEGESSVVELQAQLRGAMKRMKLGEDMQRLWDAEEMLIDLQARLRGDWARQVADYRLGMRKFAVNLQSAARGFVVRSRQREQERSWGRQSNEVIKMQSLMRARKVRQEVQYLKSTMRKEESGLKELQAAIKGALQRNKVHEQSKQATNAAGDISKFQAATRGQLLRSRMASQKLELSSQVGPIPELQGLARGWLSRRRMAKDLDALRANVAVFRALQAVSRGRNLREEKSTVRDQLVASTPGVLQLQAIARGATTRHEFELIKTGLSHQEDAIIDLQAAIRASTLRTKCQADDEALQAQTVEITDLQAFVRGRQLRDYNAALLAKLRMHGPEMIDLQGLARAVLLRGEIGDILAELDSAEDSIIQAQAAARGMLVRARYAQKQRFFKENMAKVVKVQSFVRGRLQGEAYKSLTSGKNPPVGTVKGFVHLLNDSDFDFDEEIEFERLRKTVVQHVRQNEMAETYIDQLDIKIALLVKNKITLDEVVKHQKHFGGHVGSLLTNTEMSSKDPFDLKALNKNSRMKLEHYQQLFFILQTQPQYLARLFKRIREQGTPENDTKRIENLTMSLFGYAQKRREDYYLLKLIVKSIKEEIDSCPSIQDFLRGNFFWTKLLNGYIRSPRDRKYMRDLLGPLVREHILENPELDLESDPMQIYRSAINNEELRTGRRSHRRPDIGREEAIKDPETRKTFTAHLQDLRDIADQLLSSLEELMSKMPYGIRYIAQQIFQSLTDRFPHEDQRHLVQLVGNWLWKNYLQPALTQPETWGVVDRALMPLQKRNLGEVSKVFSQIAAGRLFGGENIFLQPLNGYVNESVVTLGEIWQDLMSVPDAEAQFDIDEFNDLYSRTKPTLYIKMADIFAIHQLIASDISHVSPNKDDVMRELVHELGSAKSNESEMMGVSSTEISLTLNPKLRDVEDPEAEVKALFMETKRCILYIIRVQSGLNLMEILVKPITMEDDERWRTLLEEEFSAGSKKRAAYAEANTLVDITAMTYAELKRTALENIVRLEQHGRLTRHNHYQDLLNAIAIDIRTKHRRRVQRQRELEGVRLTLANLDEKTVWLEQQLQSYNHYIEQAMVTLQNKKGKKRFLLPFTKQYNHERELQRSGRVPKFGSFKYSARALAEKGVLVSYDGYSERAYDKINLTISSDVVGVFFLEGSMGSIQIPGASAQVPLDDLLQAQFNNHQFMTLFEGTMKLNVNLFLHLLFRKFYRDE